MGQRPATAPIRFTATPYAIDSSIILCLPDEASRRLPSRGQVAARVTIADAQVGAVLEPDGRKGHWLKLDQHVRHAAGVDAGEPVAIAIDIATDWPEPEVPADLAGALAAAPEAIRDTWNDITPMARWEWVRWVNATANPATRRRRVVVSIDKINNGKRRPCCFDLSACTDPDLARNGRLRAATP